MVEVWGEIAESWSTSASSQLSCLDVTWHALTSGAAVVVGLWRASALPLLASSCYYFLFAPIASRWYRNIACGRLVSSIAAFRRHRLRLSLGRFYAMWVMLSFVIVLCPSPCYVPLSLLVCFILFIVFLFLVILPTLVFFLSATRWWYLGKGCKREFLHTECFHPHLPILIFVQSLLLFPFRLLLACSFSSLLFPICRLLSSRIADCFLVLLAFSEACCPWFPPSFPQGALFSWTQVEKDCRSFRGSVSSCPKLANFLSVRACFLWIRRNRLRQVALQCDSHSCHVSPFGSSMRFHKKKTLRLWA